MKLGIGHDLQLAGTNTEFADIDNPNGYIYDEVFWLQATLSDGTRYDHYYITKDFKKIDSLLTRVKKALKDGVNLELENHKVWALGNPVYGSKAYEMFGGEHSLKHSEEMIRDCYKSI